MKNPDDELPPGFYNTPSARATDERLPALERLLSLKQSGAPKDEIASADAIFRQADRKLRDLQRDRPRRWMTKFRSKKEP